MSERVRGRNGAEKRYKGPRDMVGARIPPEVVREIEEARADLGLSRNDYLFAAALIALENPDAVRAAAETATELLEKQRRGHPEAAQLTLSPAADRREALARPA